MANRRYIDFPIASTSGDTDIILIWQDGANKQTTKATFLSGLPENLEDLNDVVISGLTNGQILRYDSVTGKWENTDQGNLDLNDLNDVSIVSPSNGQVLVYNSSTSKWENSSGGYVPYTGAVTTVNLGAQQLIAGQTTLTTNGSADTLTVNHTSGSGKAINVTKGGNGEGLYINKTSGSGNAATIVGTLEATTLVKTGGTSSQFLKADGSVDSSTYGTGTVTSVGLSSATSGVTIGSTPVTTSGTITLAIATASGSQNGLLSSIDWTTFNSKQNVLTNPVTGTGTTNYLPKFTGASTIGNSQVFDNGSVVGIGNTGNASYKLLVTGNNASIDSSGNNTVYLSAGTTESFLATSFIAGGPYVPLSFEVGGSKKMTLFTDGNLLLQSGGTFTNNGARLQVSGGVTSSQFIANGNSAGGFEGLKIVNASTGAAQIAFNNLAQSWLVNTRTDNHFSIFNATSSTTPFLITTSGNIGIGTNGGINLVSGWTNLTVNGSTTGIIGIKANEVDYGAMYANTANNNFVIQAYGASNNGNMIFLTVSTERARITSAGYSKFSNNGSYNYLANTFFEVNQSIADWTQVNVNKVTSGTPLGIFIGYELLSPNNTGAPFLACNDSIGERMTVRSNGGIANYQANNVNLSDIRTKKEIEPLESYWNKFKDIEIVKFKYKDQTHEDFNIGVIAQQVEKIAPEFIDIDGWGKTPKNEEPLKSVYSSDLHHATIKVLQEAMAKIESLQKEIDNLKN